MESTVSIKEADKKAEGAKTRKDLNGVALVTDRQMMEQFREFPYKHYESDTNWIPPLRIQQKQLINTAKNPFFRNAEAAFFLGYHNGQPAGRIAAILNHAYNRHNHTKAGFFGFFECINNRSLAGLLFRVAGDWLRTRGCDTLLGPMNPGMLDEIGILTEGFEYPPAIMMPYNKTWYDDLVRAAGMDKAIDLYACRVTRETVQHERAERALQIVRKRTPGVHIRPVNLRDFKREVGIIHHIFNAAWASNWGFYEIDLPVLTRLAKDLRLIIDTDFAHIAEVDGKPVGFSIALPDYNQVFGRIDGSLFPTGWIKLLWHRRKIDGIRVALTGLLPEYQGRGIDALLIRETIANGMPRGFRYAEVGWLLESNSEILRVVERFGGYKEKTYRMYRKELH